MTLFTINFQNKRSILILISLICIVPFAIAWFLAKNTYLIQDRQKNNYGHLIVPAQSFQYEVFFQNPVSKIDALEEIKGHWVLIQIVKANSCETNCQQTAYKIRQLHLMLNKEISRVRRLLLLDQTNTSDQGFDLDPNILITQTSIDLNRQLETALGQPLKEGMVVLMDPFANVMMWYAPDFDPYGILKDLQRLLRISQIG